jgi:hypothetical protein
VRPVRPALDFVRKFALNTRPAGSRRVRLGPRLTQRPEPHSDKAAEPTRVFVRDPLSGSSRPDALHEVVYVGQGVWGIAFTNCPTREIIIGVAASHSGRPFSNYFKRDRHDSILEPPQDRVGALGPFVEGLARAGEVGEVTALQ